jgi:phage FluMu protein Com
MQEVRCKYCRRLLMEADENTTGLIKIKCTRPTCKRWLELRFPFQSQKAAAGGRDKTLTHELKTILQ